jgi:hypothetical protein
LNRGNNRPATTKLAKFGSALKQLRDWLREKEGKPTPVSVKSSPIVERHARVVSDETTALVKAAIDEGSKRWSDRPTPDINGYIVGLDLGTSSVKCAYRQAYQAGDPVRCLTVPPELRSLDHPCLWQTVVWFDVSNERFSLTPYPGAVPLSGFKSRLLRSPQGNWISDDVPLSDAEAMTGFLALQLAYILGAYHLNRPLGSVGAEHFLTINIGIPVAAHDDGATLQTYERIIAAAHNLASRATDLTLSDVRQAYGNARPERPPGFEIVAELVAAMSAYASDPTAPDGAHFLVDVGASTLDMVSFNLVNKKQVSAFSAAVELLGAAALDDARAQGISDKAFKGACDKAFETVYSRARRKAPKSFHPGYRKQHVQLIKTGGGCGTKVHEPFIAEMIKPGVLGDGPIVLSLPPDEITGEACDKSRLLLAYGLTRDLPELLKLRLPGEIDDLPPEPPAGPPPITKDDV